MNKTELKVFFPPYFPSVNSECRLFPTLHPTKHCKFPGLLVEVESSSLINSNLQILTLLAHDANYKIIPFTYESMGYVSEDPALGLPELESMLLNGSLDLISMGFQKTEHRESLFSFSEIMYYVHTRLLRQKREHNLTQMWSFFRTYDSKIWLLFAAAILAQWAFCVLVRRFEAYTLKQKPIGVLECGWQVVRLQLLQPEKVNFQCLCGSFSVCLYSILQCSILLGVFGSFILASIIRPLPHISDPIVQLIHSIKKGEHFLVTNDPRNWFYEGINTSDLFPFAEMRLAVQSNPIKIVGWRDEALDLVANDKGVMFQQADEGSYYRSIDYCDIRAIEENMPMIGSHLMIRPYHPLLPLLNRAILNNRPKIRVITSKYLNFAEWNNKCPKHSRFFALTLAPYTGLGIVGFGLFGFAFFILAAEIVVETTRRYLECKLQPLLRHRKHRLS
ncbi:hypothetical protein M3Y94_01023400 [Aphelenchoides besseyi]|nr:hypothetical protein M3Y94_01023400 [Aphelenchoides besseyi]KAI6223833.1 hypothetical protein M3Y95_00818400 [Aphelenchoides besseyi]